MQQRSLPSRRSLFVVTIAIEMEAWAAAADSVGAPKRNVYPEYKYVTLFGIRIFADVIRVRISR